MRRNGKSTKPSNKPNGKRSNNNWNAKQRDEYAKSHDATDYESKRGGNDPAWYANAPALLRDSASIPFSWATGTPLTLNNSVLNDSATFPYYVVPGIEVLHITPTIGYQDKGSDPMNVAAFEVYSFVRHANSGSRNYDAPDLMLYITAISSIYSYINFLIRAYGVARLYAQGNRYFPNALITAMNIDPQNLQANLANFRYGINVLIHKAASFAAPADMTLFRRAAFLYQNVYMEGQSIKNQSYMLVPDAFFQYEDAIPVSALKENDPTYMLAGHLLKKDFDPGFINLTYNTQGTVATGKPFTVEQLLQYGESMLAPIMTSEDMNIMSGDILKAYGQNILKLNVLDTDYVITPVVNEMFLEQVQNATAAGHLSFYGGSATPARNGYAAFAVYQDPVTGVLKSHPSYGIGIDHDADDNTKAEVEIYKSYLLQNHFINTAQAVATPEIIMENTRLIAPAHPYYPPTKDINVYTGIDGNSYTYTFNVAARPDAIIVPCACGTEVVTRLEYVIAASETESPTSVGRKSVLINTDYGYNNIITTMAAAANFRFDPVMMPFEVQGTGSDQQITLMGIHHDLDNFGLATIQEIERMHETALLSMLNVSSIARV